MCRVGLLFAALVTAVLVVPAALGDGGEWLVSGAGVGGGLVAGDHIELGARSDAGGANVTGSAQNQFTLISSQFNDGGPVVCLTVSGNRAVVLFMYRTPVTVPELPGEVFPYGGVYIEDNGDPLHGQPVDRMADFAVREQTAPFFCNPNFDIFALFAQPMTSGNFVVRGD